jgi:AcrR family transcriptional regulator
MFDVLGSDDTRAIRREATRRRILDMAWRLARRDGIAALSVRDLARGVGMRAPSLYTYFASKHDIYDAMFADGMRQLAAGLAEAPRGPDPRDVFRRRARLFVRLCIEDPVRYELLFQRPVPGFEPSAESFAIGVAALAGTREALEAAGASGERALDLWRALTNGLISQQIANDPGGSRWVRLLDEAVDMFLTYQIKRRAGRGTGRRGKG